MPPGQPLKQKKPPACDRCKAKRVVCYPELLGGSCPRCVENGAECTTTPVTRRPRGTVPQEERAPRRRKRSPSHQLQSPSGADTPQDSSPEAIPVGRPLQSTVAPIQDLAPDLVQHLLDCFEQLPQRTHPDLPLAALRNSLQSVGWRTSLLPLSSQAFAYALYACAALVALHPSILGAGLLPTFEELDRAPVETTDWASFGRRREPACRALREEAFRIAQEANVVANYTDTTNAACCFLLDYLDNCRPFVGKLSRPYAVALLAHARTLAEVSEEPSFAHAMGWSAFLAIQALKSTHQGAPIIFTPGDQRMLYGADLLTLDQMTIKLRDASTAHDLQVVIHCVRPYTSQVIEVARKIDDTITGAFPRRRPLDEKAIIDCVAAIKRLDVVHYLILERIAILHPVPTPSIFPSRQPDGVAPGPSFFQSVMQAIKLVASMCYTTLVLSLHQEVQRRAREEESSANAWLGGERERERIARLRRQVTDMAREAARECAEGLDDLPGLAYGLHFSSYPEAWVQILLDEVAETGQLSLENRKALSSILLVLKLSGFSYVDSSVDSTIASIEAHLQLPSSNNLLQAPAPFPPTFLDPNALAIGDPQLNLMLTDGLDVDGWSPLSSLSAPVVPLADGLQAWDY
ncbi:hypothetical protein BCR35DRAFT_311039 [Leucosporidium creatinivorum]|uniref:Zn(2)-C6 fungal-type domain-containing protein n=1 Tax=Leucosporidium creatinivorum TaxID=106004 RepID=A0A1Y2CH22_9BASI|nr:hypothetical protein BCR35DRAFT_311039 [Leucosporidium creatinivorum]